MASESENGIYTAAERERIKQHENAENRANDVYGADDIRLMMGRAKDIAINIYERWAFDSHMKLGNTRASGTPVYGYDLMVDQLDSPDVTYKNILYVIVRTNLNLAIEHGEGTGIDLETELVTEDEFRELINYDLALENNAYNTGTKLRSDSDSFKQTSRGLIIDAVIAELRDHGEDLYSKFDNMVHGIFARPSDPRAQFIIDDAKHTVSIAGTLIKNMSKNATGEAQSAMVSRFSHISGDSGTGAFVLAMMLRDAVTKINNSAARNLYSDRMKDNLAADMLRFGTDEMASVTHDANMKRITERNSRYVSYESNEIFNLYNETDDIDDSSADSADAERPEVGSDDHGPTKSRKITFNSIIRKPAFFTYDKNENVVRCPDKLYKIFLSVTGLDSPEYSDKLVVTDISRKGMHGKSIGFSKAYENTTHVGMGTFIDRLSTSGVLVPIVTEGRTSSSIDASGTKNGEDETGAAERTSADVTRGSELLKIGGSQLDPVRVAYQTALENIISPSTFPDKSRFIAQSLGYVLPPADELAGMNSTQFAEVAVNVIACLVRYLEKLHVVTNFSVARSKHDGHATVTVLDGQNPIDADKFESYLKVLTGRNSVTKNKMPTGFPSMIRAMDKFVYYFPGTNSLDENSEIPMDKFEPEIQTLKLITYYADNGGNDHMANLASLFLRSWAESIVMEGFPAALLKAGKAAFSMDAPGNSELGDFFKSTKVPGINFRARLLGTIGGQSVNRQRLIKDWIDYLDWLGISPDDEYMESTSTEENVDTGILTLKEIVNMYKSIDMNYLADAFQGPFGEYIRVLYNGDKNKELDRDKLVSLAQTVSNDDSYPYVMFDPAVTTATVRSESTGKVIGNVGEFNLPVKVAPQTVAAKGTAKKPAKPRMTLQQRTSKVAADLGLD